MTGSPFFFFLFAGNHGRGRKQGSDQAVRYFSPTSSADHRVREGELLSSNLISEASDLTSLFFSQLRTVIGELKSCVPQIGLIVCDEGQLSRFDSLRSRNFADHFLIFLGHRLKSKDAKTSKMFDVLSTKKSESKSPRPRSCSSSFLLVLLANLSFSAVIRDHPFGYTTSERPRRVLGYGELKLVAQSRRLSSLILSFLFAPSSQVNFINPGILDAYSTFTKIYEKPIVRSVPLVSLPSFELTFPRLFSSSHRSDLEILTARRESSNSVKLEVRNSQRSELSSSFDVPPTSSANS